MLDLETAGYKRSQNRDGWEHEDPPEGELAFIDSQEVLEHDGRHFIYPERWKREDAEFLADLCKKASSLMSAFRPTEDRGG